MTKPLAGTSDKPNKKSAPKLRDGVMKRGTTWSYVIRVKDSETGESKPKWVGGFATEEAAKAARDEARVNARRGEYVDRNEITVSEFLDDWIEDHAMEIKPGTLEDYRITIRLYIKPFIGCRGRRARRRPVRGSGRGGKGGIP
ncbi:tyrosine-type recombinase/integrase, partial [Streptosporangium sp. NPDC001682]